jgi:diacylglycerol O-acyltransferase / wax synthase
MGTQRMRGVDSAWLHMDSLANPMVITTLMWTDDPLDWGLVEKLVMERLVERYPRFRQIVEEPLLGAGAPRWRDDPDFDLALHLHRIGLPAPGDRRALGGFISDVMSGPLPAGRPLWQAYLVDGFEGGAAIITRIHHCVADGIALMRVLMTLADAGADDSHVVFAAEEQHSTLSQLLHRSAALTHPTRLAVSALRTVGELGSLGRVLSLPDERRAFARTLKGVKRVAWSPPVPLSAVKSIGAGHGATVNDVLLTVVAGALRPHLVPDLASVRAMVPFNLRASLDAPVPTSLGNDFGLIFVDLPIGIDDPVSRLAEVKRMMDAMKASPEGAASLQLLGIMGMLPVWLQRVMAGTFAAKGSLVLTNVPGPRTPVLIAGAPVRGVLAWVPQSGDVGLGLSIISYDGGVTIGVAADTGVLEDPHTVADAFEHELALLGGFS